MKIFRTIFAAMLIIAVSMGFSSCGDDNNNDEPQGGATLDKCIVTFGFTPGGVDHATIIDTQVEVTDMEGKKFYGDYTGEKKSYKTKFYTTFPCTFTLKVTDTLKDGVTLDKDSYSTGYTLAIGAYAFNTDESLAYQKSHSIGTKLAYSKDALAKAFPKTSTYKVTFDAKGAVSIEKVK